MNIERGLQIGFAMLAALGTVLLGMGESDAKLPLLASIVAGASVYLTDRRGWLRLSQNVANWAGVGAVCLAGSEWIGRYDPDSQLLALANLLVYLQCVQMFREKSVSIYWQIMVLSLMQVAVAAALNLSPLFGFVLAAYLAVGLVTASLFYLHREALRLRGTREDPPPRSAPVRWTLTGQQASCMAAPSAAALDHLLARPYWIQLGLVGLGTLLLTGLMFLAVPRVGSARWRPVTGGASPMEVGVTESITLGATGQVFENPEATLRIEFFNHQTNERYRLAQEPYLRGVTLSNYTRGTWNRSADPDDLVRPLPESDPGDWYWHPDLVRQKITIEPLDTDVLYAVYPLLNSRLDQALLFDRSSRQLQRPRGLMGSHHTYEVVTQAFDQGRQRVLTPARGDFEPWERTALLRLPREGKLTRLPEIARLAVRDAPAQNPFEQAFAIERFLRFSGRFRYTLDLKVTDPTLDPIEDFLINTRAGHCEYFASSLALMLRSVGIPSRVVVGFHGGDWNTFGSFYQVRQLHTHAWVEAYIEPNALPRDLPPPAAQWLSGGWLRLDATPGEERNAGLPPPSLTVQTYRQAVDYFKALWSNYVLGMDAERQRETIYEPLLTGLRETLRSLADRNCWLGLGERLFWFLRTERSGWFSGEWFNWRAGASASFVLLIAWYVLGGVRRQVVRRLGRWRATRDGPADRLTVAFQRRLESLLTPLDLVRGRSQTQLEFARQALDRLRGDSATRPAAGVPLIVAEAFYRVRFGGATLDKAEFEAVEQSLDKLESALQLVELPPRR